MQPETLNPCPICGEREMLNNGCSGEVTRLVDGEVRLDPDGKGLVCADEVEFINCVVCEAMMPRTVWQGERPTPAYRAALAAYYLTDEAEVA